MARFVPLLFLFSVVISAEGCGQRKPKPSNLPPLFPLTIRVLQQGTPLSGAFVRLVPEKPEMPWHCGATTDSNGNAVIKTLGEFDGAPEGSYKILISKLEMTKAIGTDLSNLDAPPPKTSENVNLVDPKYSRADTTTLTVTVEKSSPSATVDVGEAVRSVRKGPR